MIQAGVIFITIMIQAWGSRRVPPALAHIADVIISNGITNFVVEWGRLAGGESIIFEIE